MNIQELDDESVNTASLENIRSPLANGYERGFSPSLIRSNDT